MSKIKLDKIEDAISAIKKGEIIIVVDDENRENEGDFVTAAETIDSSKINFMAKNGRGLICVPMSEKLCSKLSLEKMVPNNTDPLETAFTVSVDFKGNGVTPYSATPRAAPRPKVQPRPKPRPRINPDEPRPRIKNENIRINPRSPRETETGSNGGRSRNRQVVPSQSTRPRITPPSQPRQIRGRSQQPSIQQTQPRGRSSQQGSRSSVRQKN